MRYLLQEQHISEVEPVGMEPIVSRILNPARRFCSEWDRHTGVRYARYRQYGARECLPNVYLKPHSVLNGETLHRVALPLL